MWQRIVKYRIWIILWCLVLLPLLESLSPATLWGLNWQSPMFTAYVKAYLLLIKLGMLFIVGTVLLALYPHLKPKLKRPIIPCINWIMPHATAICVAGRDAEHSNVSQY